MLRPFSFFNSRFLPGIIIGAIGIALYLNTYYHGFVLDDITIVGQNHLVQQGFKGIPEILKTSYWYGYNGSTDLGYRPLSLVMFAIEWQISPNNSHIHHLFSILLYGLTGFFLFITLRKLFEKPLQGLEHYKGTVAFIASLLFMAHPVHTEVVANIKSRDEMLSFFFSVLTINFIINYVRSLKPSPAKANSEATSANDGLYNSKLLTPNSKPSSLFLALLCFFLALISKENSITIVAIIPFVIYFCSDVTLKKNMATTATFVAIIIGYIALRMALPEGFQFRKGMPIPDNTLAAAPDIVSRLATAIMLLGHYLKILFFPHPLISDYSFSTFHIIGWGNWQALASVAVYLFLAAYAIFKIKNKNPVAFGILFYLLTFSVVSNIVFLVGATLAERFLYMPSLGFCISIAALLSKLMANKKRNGYTLSLAITAVLFLFFSIKTIARNKAWKDNFTLFSTDLKSAPNSCKLNYYYAVSLVENVYYTPSLTALNKDFMVNDAIEKLEKALAITTDFIEAVEELGYSYYVKGDLPTAMDYYEKAIHSGSRNPSLYNNYGAACSELHQYDKAITLLKRAVELNPNYAEAITNLGIAYNGKGNYREAIPFFKKAIELKPAYAIAYKSVARSYANIKEFDTTITYLNKVATMTPNDYEIYLYLGLSYKYKGDTATARKYLLQANELKKKADAKQ